jgi:branched-subunit amino acid ABC-type transport system permease component
MDNLQILFSAPIFSLQLLIDGLRIGAIFALAAYGMALVWGVMKIIKFARGEFVILGGGTWPSPSARQESTPPPDPTGITMPIVFSIVMAPVRNVSSAVQFRPSVPQATIRSDVRVTWKRQRPMSAKIWFNKQGRLRAVPGGSTL